MTIEMRIDCPVQFFINFGCVVARWDMAYFQKFLRWRLARLLERKRWKRGVLYVTRLCLRVMRKHLFWTVKMWNVCRARVFFKFCVFPYLFFLRGSLSTCSWASCCQVSCAGTVCSASSPARSGGRWGESSMSFAFSSNVQTRLCFTFISCFIFVFTAGLNKQKWPWPAGDVDKIKKQKMRPGRASPLRTWRLLDKKLCS